MGAVKLDSGWIAARANEVEWSGEQLTTSHVPSLKISPWMGAVVPGTILTTLLHNKAIPDPFYGLENQNVPDIADVGRDYYTFWFFNKFEAPKKDGFKRAWLRFRAINYSAEVYVNGFKYSLPGGMFFRHKLDVTEALKTSENYLAVLVHPPEHPGRIPPEGGQGGDHDIAKDVAAQYVEGWDWIIPIRDRNTGIWDEVSVSFTGPVALGDTHLVSSFFDDYKRIYLHISCEVTNTSPSAVTCTVHAQVTLDADKDLCLVENVKSQDIEIPAGSTVVCTFTPLFFYKPRLWWPNGMGEQPLYQVDIAADIKGEESDTWTHQHGFRKISSFIDPTTNSRRFQVNGKPVFIRGGNWIVSDGLLRLSKERYETDIGFHAEMNLNMMRVWGGALAERPAFYGACDKHGILVWQEFWITGDCNGRGVPPSDATWPLDHQLFLKCARDTVKLLRNHASLALWVGGNEQHPADDINQALTSELQLFGSLENEGRFKDPSLVLDGSRLYIQGSLWEGFAAGNGAFKDGPYTIQNPEDYFKDDYYPYGFNPEIGSVGVPLAATIKATMSKEAWDIPKTEEVSEGLVKEIPNATWELHTYIPYAQPDKKVPHQIAKYGEPQGLDDFCSKAQLVNYVQYRALMESWNSKMWTKYTGVLIWKTQNPWPGLRGQLYDHFMDQTGGFFGVKAACETVHVQLNLNSHKIEAVNTTGDAIFGVNLEASVWGLQGELIYQKTTKNLTIPAYKTIQVADLGHTPQQVCFVLLKLTSGAKLLSRNFYWIHEQGGDYRLLEGDFTKRKVGIEVSIQSFSRNEAYKVTLLVENPKADDKVSSSTASRSQGVAFWLHISVHCIGEQRKEDTRVLPVRYSDNYFSLVPGESMEVDISFKLEKGKGSPRIMVHGWNTASIALEHESWTV